MHAGLPLVGATVHIRRLKKTWIRDAKGEFAMKDVADGKYEVDTSFVGCQWGGMRLFAMMVLKTKVTSLATG